MQFVINLGVWLFVIVLVAFSITHTDVVAPEVAVFIFTFWSLYWVTSRAARTDRVSNITDATLPLWARRILFLGQPNPFRRKTVIYQTIFMSSSPIIFVIWLLFPNTLVNYATLATWIVAAVVLIPICDIRVRRRYNDTNDIQRIANILNDVDTNLAGEMRAS